MVDELELSLFIASSDESRSLDEELALKSLLLDMMTVCLYRPNRPVPLFVWR
jgi:hypothetical protein